MAGLSPRVARTRRAILDAALWIMSHDGAAAVTPQQVALRAGVGRATVYRYWPDGADLVQAALERIEIPLAAPVDGPIERRVAVELARLANELKSMDTRRLMSILLERAERLKAGEALRQKLVATFVVHLEDALAQAVERGELDPAPDPAEMFDRLVGPLWSRRMIRGTPIDDEFIERVVADALRPWRP